MKGYLFGKCCTADRVVAIIEKSAGNETVGDRWIETRTFDIDWTIRNVMDWAAENGITGRLFLTPDLSTVPEDK